MTERNLWKLFSLVKSSESAGAETLKGSGANKISTTIYSGMDDSFSSISCIVREFLHQNPLISSRRGRKVTDSSERWRRRRRPKNSSKRETVGKTLEGSPTVSGFLDILMIKIQTARRKFTKKLAEA